YIDISNWFEPDSETAQSHFDYTDSVIAEIAGTKTLEKVTSKKVVEIGGYTTYQLADGVYQFTNHAEPIILRIYQIDGEYYLL
ncbi:MAG: hypothetical protein K2N49_03375, partial [Ruminococcus sp.]|nr:hypothetical protein [Ruminococcus sp.]